MMTTIKDLKIPIDPDTNEPFPLEWDAYSVLDHVMALTPDGRIKDWDDYEHTDLPWRISRFAKYELLYLPECR